MSPIPGEPLDPRQPDLTTKDGKKVKLKLPGLTPLGAPKPAPTTPVEPESVDESR